MQKLINDAFDFVDEVIDGIESAHSNDVRRIGRRSLVRASAPIQNKVGIATGGGSGHLPLFLGYLGQGLADGVAVGNVFSSPSAEEMLAVLKEVNAGRGVVQLFGNYSGDALNFGRAANIAESIGIEVRAVRCADDVASAPRGQEQRRRGIAGIFFLYKVAGASAASGADIDKVCADTEEASFRVRSVGVALAPCTVPAAGKPTFELPEGTIEIGMGIHGEPGVSREPLTCVDEICRKLVDVLLSDLPRDCGETVDLLINGLGATPHEELYLVYRQAAKLLQKAGLRVRRRWIGEYVTSLEMAGTSISVLLVNDELAELMDAPSDSAFVSYR